MANPKPKIIYDLFFILGKTDVMIIPKNDCGIIVPFEKIKWRIDSKRKAIKGKFAREIHQKIGRIMSGKLNSADRQEIKENDKTGKKMIITWK